MKKGYNLSLFYILFLFIVPSCGLKHKKKLNGGRLCPPVFFDEKQLLRNYLIEKSGVEPSYTVAHDLCDIPLPIDAKRCSFQEGHGDDKGSLFSYKIGLSVPDLSSFFEGQMEAFGWFFICSAKHQEHSLLFKKKSKYCIISIRPMERLLDSSLLIITVASHNGL